MSIQQTAKRLFVKFVKKISPKPDVFTAQQKKKWRLWQIESSISCNLKCIMCPWEGWRQQTTAKGLLQQETWDLLLPHLNDVQEVDFTGGGEPLLHKKLLPWVVQAKAAGCAVGFLTNGLLLNETLSLNLIAAELDWIGFSLDGADSKSYETIRKGSDFEKVCANIRFFTKKRNRQTTKVLINFVIMTSNHHQLEAMVKLADQLKVDQINFKQCDVIRGDYGKGLGMFASDETKSIKELKKSISKASRMADKLGIKTNSFSLLPEEQPVCDQDPRGSIFVRYDGSVSPCINLAYGGPSSFLGEEIIFPTICYGNLSETGLPELWQSEACLEIRSCFAQRIKAHDRILTTSDYGNSLQKLKEVFNSAIKAMPEAPAGCGKCHYLYDI